MKKFTLIISIFIFSSVGFSQGRLVINNNGYVVIDNSAFVVLQNPNPNALTTLGTGGNIISEGEDDVIKWEIGLTTGTYTIPWTTNSNTKIPLSINKTTTGTGANAEFILSTWECATDMNAPWPSNVTNMNWPTTVDGSLFVADRFWHIDALSYTTKPDIILSMNYDPAANEIGGANTIIESNLQAQRFNTTLGHWETYKVFGTNDAVNDRVINIAIPSADFFEDFILVDNTAPLPVTLVNFDAECNNGEVEISWTTASEINNDYFVVEKSFDAINFFELTTVQGNGNSTVTNHYTAYDTNPSNGTTYYRLKQVDFDATTTYHNIVTTNCNNNGFEVNEISLANNTLNFNVSTSLDENLNVLFYDYRGRLISTKKLRVTEGANRIELNNLELSTGIYMLSIVGEYNNFSTKLLSK